MGYHLVEFLGILGLAMDLALVVEGEVALWDFRGLGGGFGGLRGGKLCHRSFSPTARLSYKFCQRLYIGRREDVLTSTFLAFFVV